jgi:signal peptidase I
MSMLSITDKLKSISSYAQILFCALVLAFVLKAFVVDAVVIPSSSMERTLLVGDYVLVNKLVHGASTQGEGHGISSEAGFKFVPSIRQIGRGDVVVFQFPSQERSFETTKELFVKRCVGISGDKIEIRQGNLYINGELAPSASTDASGDDKGESLLLGNGENFGPLIVPRAGEEILLTQSNYRHWENFIEHEGHSVTFIPNHGVVIDGVPATRYTAERNYLFVMGDNRDHSFDSRSWGFLPEENVVGTATCVYWSMDRTNYLGGISDFFSAIRWNRVGTLKR